MVVARSRYFEDIKGIKMKKVGPIYTYKNHSGLFIDPRNLGGI